MERKKNSEASKPCFYKLSAARLPDDLYQKEVPASEWIGDGETPTLPWMETTTNPKGFASGSLGKVMPLDKIVDWERCIGIPMYMIGNVSPIAVPLSTLVWLVFDLDWAKYLALGIAGYHLTLFSVWRLYFVPIFLKRYKRGNNNLDPKDHFQSQYLFTERNVTKYCSTSYVWPESLHRPNLMEGTNRDRPVIYCMIPHGLAPYGLVGYPFFSKVWNSKLCSWTCAPILFNFPMVGHYLKCIGYIAAKSKPIVEALTKKDRNIGIVLDGIDGMFANANGGDKEVAAINTRKGICKIALKANVAIVPIYGFGHTGIYDVWVDPLGILRFLSAKLHMSLTPFFGRGGLFMGPPKRTVPVTICLGDPIYPPDDIKEGEITQQHIDQHHARLLEGFAKVFETHKQGYYGAEVGAKKKLVFSE